MVTNFETFLLGVLFCLGMLISLISLVKLSRVQKNSGIICIVSEKPSRKSDGIFPSLRKIETRWDILISDGLGLIKRMIHTSVPKKSQDIGMQIYAY